MIAMVGCATSTRDRQWVEEDLAARLGDKRVAIGTAPAVRLEDGVDEDEVVALALWQHPTLEVQRTRLDSARATLDEAGRLTNPQLSLFGPIGPADLVATLIMPIESAWQLPTRTEAAARAVDAAAEATVMVALDLVRDVSLAHVNLGLAADRLQVRAELDDISRELARIAAVRERVGESSPLDTHLFAAEAQVAADAADVATTDVDVAQLVLANQLGLSLSRSVGTAAEGLRAVFTAKPDRIPARARLLQLARVARPDARSAAFAIDAAAARAGLQRGSILPLAAIVDGHWTPNNGPALRLGARLDLPIFGLNPGGIGRADADLRQATAQHEVVARAIVDEVVRAEAALRQASRSRTRFATEVLPHLEAALTAARQSFDAGEDNYLVVLDVLRRVADGRLRLVELTAAERRAFCELERAVGARLSRVADVADIADGTDHTTAAVDSTSPVTQPPPTSIGATP